jgi:hypothetical protein
MGLAETTLIFIENRKDLGMWRSSFGFGHSPECDQQPRPIPSFGNAKQAVWMVPVPVAQGNRLHAT